MEELKYTRHQVPRATRADAETLDKIYLIKNVSTLRATYQIKLLAFKATTTRKKLLLKVPKGCKFHTSLKELMKMTNVVRREDL